MHRNWWGENYTKANEKARYSIQDAGLSTEHIAAFKEYTNALLSPRETKTQVVMGYALSLGAVLGIIVCVYILTNGLTFQKFDKDLKSGSLSAITGILGFLAGKTGKNS
jgi:hypothetical protein